MKFCRILLSFSLFFVICSCDLAWNLANRGSLKNDIQELFERYGVLLSDPVCDMIGTTRSGTCQFRASSVEIASLVLGLNLKEVETGEQLDVDLSIKIPESKVGCLACRSFKEVRRMKVFQSERRAKELRLKSGRAFEYFIVFRDLDSDKVCVQVSYAYG